MRIPEILELYNDSSKTTIYKYSHSQSTLELETYLCWILCWYLVYISEK